MTKLSVQSEIAQLYKLLIHSPGSEMDNMLPNKLHEWLIDDIIDTQLIQKEYEQYAKTLLLFLDPQKIVEKKSVNPNLPTFHASDKVLEIQYLLATLFSNPTHQKKTFALLENIATLEKLHVEIKVSLIKLYEEALAEFSKKPVIGGSKIMDLVKSLITGKMVWLWEKNADNSGNWTLQSYKDDPIFIMKPIPNLIFTRDIAVTINKNILITKTASEIRQRETVLMKYIAECYLFAGTEEHDYNNMLNGIIEVSEDVDHFQFDENEMKEMNVTFEGGDIMMVSHRHLMIGKSQRTSFYAINKLIHKIFEKNIGIELITIIEIAEKRSQMHIDTVFTQVNPQVWMLYGRLSKKAMQQQAEKSKMQHAYTQYFNSLQSSIHHHDEPVNFYQYYCPSNSYHTQQSGKADFYIYTQEELDKLFNAEERLTKNSYSTLPKNMAYHKPTDIEDLLAQISTIEFGHLFNGQVHFVYSGNNLYPFDEREQWSDSSNVLCLGNGVVIGYDRNRKTIEAFEHIMHQISQQHIPSSNQKLYEFVKSKGESAKYYSIPAQYLLEYVQEYCPTETDIVQFTSEIKNMLITVSSGELSRARGGSHCMSMPMWRGTI